MEKKILNINLDELCEAMEDSSYEYDYYLALETGEVLFISDYMDDEETTELKDRIEEDSDRYEQIPKAESYEGYQDMVDFIATLDNERLTELLEVAINVRGPSDGSRMCYLTTPRKVRNGSSSKMSGWKKEPWNGLTI